MKDAAVKPPERKGPKEADTPAAENVDGKMHAHIETAVGKQQTPRNRGRQQPAPLFFETKDEKKGKSRRIGRVRRRKSILASVINFPLWIRHQLNLVGNLLGMRWPRTLHRALQQITSLVRTQNDKCDGQQNPKTAFLEFLKDEKNGG